MKIPINKDLSHTWLREPEDTVLIALQLNVTRGHVCNILRFMEGTQMEINIITQYYERKATH